MEKSYEISLVTSAKKAAKDDYPNRAFVLPIFLKKAPLEEKIIYAETYGNTWDTIELGEYNE